MVDLSVKLWRRQKHHQDRAYFASLFDDLSGGPSEFISVEVPCRLKFRPKATPRTLMMAKFISSVFNKFFSVAFWSWQQNASLLVFSVVHGVCYFGLTDGNMLEVRK